MYDDITKKAKKLYFINNYITTIYLLSRRSILDKSYTFLLSKLIVFYLILSWARPARPTSLQ